MRIQSLDLSCDVLVHFKKTIICKELGVTGVYLEKQTLTESNMS